MPWWMPKQVLGVAASAWAGVLYLRAADRHAPPPTPMRAHAKDAFNARGIQGRLLSCYHAPRCQGPPTLFWAGGRFFYTRRALNGSPENGPDGTKTLRVQSRSVVKAHEAG